MGVSVDLKLDSQSVSEKIHGDYYRTKLNYPPKPLMPQILHLKVKDLTEGDFWIPVSKKPKTDAGKTSTAGRIEGMNEVFNEMGFVNRPLEFNQVRENAAI